MIGLTIDHIPVLGVVFQPIGSNLYLAAPGMAAIIVKGGSRRRLEVSKVKDPAEVRLVASRSHRDEKIDQVRRALGTTTSSTSARSASSSASSRAAIATCT